LIVSYTETINSQPGTFIFYCLLSWCSSKRS